MGMPQMLIIAFQLILHMTPFNGTKYYQIFNDTKYYWIHYTFMLLGELSNLICRKGWDFAQIMALRGFFCNPAVCDEIPTFSEDRGWGAAFMEEVLCYVFFSDLGAVRDRPPWRIEGDGKLADSTYSHKPSIKI